MFDTQIADFQTGIAEPSLEARAPLGAFSACTMVSEDAGYPIFVFPPAAYIGGVIRYAGGQHTLTFVNGGVLEPFELTIDS